MSFDTFGIAILLPRFPRGILSRPDTRSQCPRCEADGLIRQLESNDWERLRDARLWALASDPDAFLVTVEEARTFPDERWREHAEQTDRNTTFVYERAGRFDAMVAAFVGEDPGTVFLVGMWVAPHLRGSGIASQLVEQVVAWSCGHGRSRIVLSVEGSNGRAARLYEKCGFVQLVEPPPLPYEARPGNRFYQYTLDAR